MWKWFPSPNDIITNLAANIIVLAGAAIAGAVVTAARTWIPRLSPLKISVPSLIGGIALGVSKGVPTAVRAWVPGLSRFEDTVLSLIIGIALGELIAVTGYAIFAGPMRRLVPSPLPQTAPTTFGDVARAIRPLLEENRSVFLKFGPNSGADATRPVRFDLTLWEKAKIDLIVPNNERIRTLLAGHRGLISENDLPVVEQMQAHIYALREHVRDPYFDYSDYQFPKAFRDLIDHAVNEK